MLIETASTNNVFATRCLSPFKCTKCICSALKHNQNKLGPTILQATCCAAYFDAGLYVSVCGVIFADWPSSLSYSPLLVWWFVTFIVFTHSYLV